MASTSGTFSAAQQLSSTLLLRVGEQVTVSLTPTGSSWAVSLVEALGNPPAGYRPLVRFTTTQSGFLYRNTTDQIQLLALKCESVSGTTVAYSMADVSGDQVLEEWRAADGTLVARMTDLGLFSDTWPLEGGASALGVVNVKDPTYGAVGDDSADDTAAIQTAIDAAGAGGCLVFPEGIYRCVGLTASANAQRWIGYGQVILKKNGNGAILTHSGNDFTAENIQWRGESATPAYTGHNLVLNGDNPKLVMCGSRYAYDRALLATGNHVQIIGTNDIYQTATGAGYDIEIGISGTATLYHQVYGVYTSQATGGIKLIDVGSHVITASQFGKYWVDSGTSPAGVNGGMATGCRILGAVQIDISNSILVGNQFGSSATINYASGTSGHEYWGNVDSDGVITNAGNGSAAIIRQVNNDGAIGLKFGDDASAALMQMNRSTGQFTFPSVQIPNNVNYRMMRASPNDTSRAGALLATSSDNVQLVADVGSIQVSVPTGQSVQAVVNGSEVAAMNASGIRVGVAAGSQSSGVVAFGNGTQTTVGAAGGASALPATPTGYLRFYLGSTQYVIPYYAAA